MAYQKKNNPFLFYSLNAIGFLTSIVGLLIPKLAALLVCALLIEYLDKSLLSNLIASLAFLLTLGLCFIPSRYIVEKGLLLSEYSRRFNVSYIIKYGESFAYPLFEDYRIEPEEYYAYNKKFKIDQGTTVCIVTPIVLITALNYTNTIGFIVILLITTVIAISTWHLAGFINKCLVKKSKRYENIKAYCLAIQIHRKVQEEIRNNNIPI